MATQFSQVDHMGLHLQLVTTVKIDLEVREVPTITIEAIIITMPTTTEDQTLLQPVVHMELHQEEEDHQEGGLVHHRHQGGELEDQHHQPVVHMELLLDHLHHPEDAVEDLTDNNRGEEGQHLFQIRMVDLVETTFLGTEVEEEEGRMFQTEVENHHLLTGRLAGAGQAGLSLIKDFRIKV